MPCKLVNSSLLVFYFAENHDNDFYLQYYYIADIFSKGVAVAL